MPYINTQTNVVITKEKELEIKEKLGKAIEFIPGKSENWLMVSFQDQASMYFKGDSESGIAFAEVKLFGKADSVSYNKLTAAITKILAEELEIAPDHIYVKYEEAGNWGWNGSNF